jgi:sec-independent protein translocase protein TatA
MESLGMPELLVILGVAVLLFGGKKIPELAKGIGEGIRNFKNALKSEPDEPEKPAARVEAKLVLEPKIVEPKVVVEKL